MNKLKVGLIGTGSLADFHIAAYRKNIDIEVTALCDSNVERARHKAVELGIRNFSVILMKCWKVPILMRSA